MVFQGCEIDVVVGTDVRDGSGSTRVINWCGCFLQDSHPAVRSLGFLPEEGHGVYVTRYASLFLCKRVNFCSELYTNRPVCSKLYRNGSVLAAIYTN